MWPEPLRLFKCIALYFSFPYREWTLCIANLRRVVRCGSCKNIFPITTGWKNIFKKVLRFTIKWLAYNVVRSNGNLSHKLSSDLWRDTTIMLPNCRQNRSKELFFQTYSVEAILFPPSCTRKRSVGQLVDELKEDPPAIWQQYLRPLSLFGISNGFRNINEINKDSGHICNTPNRTRIKQITF